MRVTTPTDCRTAARFAACLNSGMAVTARERKLLLDGEWVETGEWHEVRSPYSGDVVGRVARAGAAEARRAVDAAARAMAEELPAYARAEILDRTADLVGERQEEIARTISDEAGKPMKAARVEADRAVSTFRSAAAEARTLAGEVVPMDATPAGAGKVAFTARRPIGVVGAISPFNFPFNLVAHKVAPALAAGCAVVLKPASQTPLSALLLAELEAEAGLPPGWLNVLVGSASELGDVLVEDERVRLISFTGSAEVGWSLRARAARKKVLLELGNATPVIVEPDADVDEAAAKAAANAFSFAGQSCISIQRVYVGRPAYDDFLAAFLPKVNALHVGDPGDDATDVGPVIDEDAKERILAWIDEAKSQGATVLAGGETTDEGLIGPTVLGDVTPEMKVSCLEVFGPLCTVSPYDTLEEAFELANGTEYGLQAAVFTSDVKTALTAGSALDFGGVLVNEAPTFRADQMPYGGVKASGNTKEGPHYSVREMTEERLVVIAL
jgi:acyl-CoA reductase-like NAD-dependent aldehyde dehydrogenase